MCSLLSCVRVVSGGVEVVVRCRVVGLWIGLMNVVLNDVGVGGGVGGMGNAGPDFDEVSGGTEGLLLSSWCFGLLVGHLPICRVWQGEGQL